MRLSFQEKAKLGDLYERNRHWLRYGSRWPLAALAPFIVPMVISGRDLFHDLSHPSSSEQVLLLCLASFLIGISLTSTVMQWILCALLRKRDEFVLALAEKHFPDDCPWKEEALVLQKADELQHEAKASGLLPDPRSL